MVWQLIRIDPCFGWTLRVLLAAPLAALLPAPDLIGLLAVYSVATGVAMSSGALHRRTASYQLALPLPAKSIWLSNVVVQILLLCAPGLFFLPRFGLRALAIVLAYFFHGAVLRAWEPSREGAPGWYVTISALAFVLPLALLQTHQEPWMFAVILVASCLLYGRTWWRLPESFQLASADLAAARRVSGGGSGSATGWLARNMPFLRAFSGWTPLLFLLIIPFQVLQLRRGEVVLAMVFLPVVSQILGKRLAWMEVTPTTRSRIFGWSMGLPMAVHGVCYLLFTLLRREGSTFPQDVRDLAAQFCWGIVLVTVMFCSTTPDVRLRLQLMPGKLRVMLTTLQALVFIGLIAPIWGTGEPDHHISVVGKAALLIAPYLTAEPARLVLLCVLVQVAGYFLMQRAFARTEALPCNAGNEFAMVR